MGKYLRSIGFGALMMFFLAALAPTQAEFLTCYRITVPAGTADASIALLFDNISGDIIFLNVDNNVDGDVVQYNIAVSSTQSAGVITSDGAGLADGELGVFTDGGATVEVVDYDGNCRAAILDGRLNKYDLGALAYVYPTNDGYSVWELNLQTMEGYEALSVTRAQVDEALANPPQQMGETSERGTSLWAISATECQMNHYEQDGKLNEFLFACAD